MVLAYVTSVAAASQTKPAVSELLVPYLTNRIALDFGHFLKSLNSRESNDYASYFPNFISFRCPAAYGHFTVEGQERLGGEEIGTLDDKLRITAILGRQAAGNLDLNLAVRIADFYSSDAEAYLPLENIARLVLVNSAGHRKVLELDDFNSATIFDYDQKLGKCPYTAYLELIH